MNNIKNVLYLIANKLKSIVYELLQMFILHKVHWMAISMLNFLSPQNVFRSEIRIRLRDLRKWWLNDIPPRPPNRARLAEIKLHMIPRMIRSIALPDAGKYIRVKLTRWLIFPLLTIDPEKGFFAKNIFELGFHEMHEIHSKSIYSILEFQW